MSMKEPRFEGSASGKQKVKNTTEDLETAGSASGSTDPRTNPKDNRAAGSAYEGMEFEDGMIKHNPENAVEKRVEDSKNAGCAGEEGEHIDPGD